MEKPSQMPEVEPKWRTRARFLTFAAMSLGLNGCNKPGLEKTVETQKPTVVSESKEKTKAEKILEQFPKEIPGAAHVEVVPAEGAEKVFVVIDQTHINPVPDFEKNPSPVQIYWQLHAIDKSQKNIAEVIKFLKERYEVSGVLTEGLTDEHINQMKTRGRSEFDQQFDDTVKDYFNYIQSKWSDFPVTEQMLKTDLVYLKGGSNFVSVNNQIPLRAAESEIILQKLDNEALQFNNFVGVNAKGKIERDDIPDDMKARWDVVMHEREEFVVSQVAQDTGEVSVVVFGSAHSWTDNIGTHNKTANRKMGLVVISPEFSDASFFTNILRNAGFSDDQDSWIEFHFRDFIETFEATKTFDQAKFEEGKREMKQYQAKSGLTDQQVYKAIDIILQKCATEVKK